MPVSGVKVFCFSAGSLSLLLCCSTVLVHTELEQCKSKQVEVDLDEHYTINYSICDDPTSVCFQQYNVTESCEPEQELERIVKAKLIDHNGNKHTLDVLDDRKGFTVLLPEDGDRFTGTGVFHHKVVYEYETSCADVTKIGDCTGWVKDLRLSVTVVDFKLRLSSSNDADILETSTIDEVQIKSERNVSLVCLSGLSDRFSSLNIPSTFIFYPKHDVDDYNVSASCKNDDAIPVNNGKWIISRQQSPPHDCVLTIVNFGGHDVGRYRCAGVLSQSDSSIQEEDWSNKLHLKLFTKLQSAAGFNSSPLGPLVTLFFGVIVASTIAIFLVFMAIGGYSALAYYRRRRRRRQRLYQVLPRFYESTSTINDLSRPHTPNPNNDAENDRPLVVYSDYDHDLNEVSEIESSFDERRPSSRVHRRPKVVQVEVENEQPQHSPNLESSGTNDHREVLSSNSQQSMGQEGVNAYMEHMQIQPAVGETPKDSTAPLNPNYRCPNCHKTYHDDQRLFWARHWNERDKRCAPCSQKPKDSVAFGTAVKGDADTSGPSNTETGGPDVVSGLQVDSQLIGSGASIKSAGEQGREFYGQYMNLQPAIGETPKDSDAPLNPNYRCPNCQKTYHDDHRSFWARHWNERDKRCAPCSQKPKDSVAFGTAVKGDTNISGPSNAETGPPIISHITSGLSLQSKQPNGPDMASSLQVESQLVGSGASIKSAGEQGREFYGQYMNLQPAIGETPKDSDAPLNPNYRCPNCQKTYHDDHRSFWARHWNEREKRCIACTQPNAILDDTNVPLSSTSTLTGDPSTQPTYLVTPPTPLHQTMPTAVHAKVDQHDLNFMSESDSNSNPLSSSEQESTEQSSCKKLPQDQI